MATNICMGFIKTTLVIYRGLGAYSNRVMLLYHSVSAELEDCGFDGLLMKTG